MNLASSLNLTPSALKSQTIGSRSFRISISPNNGSTFQGLSKLSLTSVDCGLELLPLRFIPV